MVVLRSRLQKRQGFTLLELLVVLAIIVILGALVIPVTSQSLTGMGITTDGDALVSTLTNAREAATASGKPVELRFTYPDAGGSSVASIAAFSLADDGSYRPEGLPWSPGEANGIDLNPMFTNLPDNTAPILQDADGKWYRAFVFRPDGSAELDPNTTHFVTLRNLAQAANYYAVALDPATGTVRAYRP